MRKRILSILLTLTMIVSMTPLMAYADEPADTPIEPTAATEPAPTSGGEGNSEENLYTVTFDANDGSGEMEAETVESGEYTLPECKFAAPQGKKFYKWQIGDKKYAAGEKANLDSSTVTATALWIDTNIVITSLDQLNEGHEQYAFKGMATSSIRAENDGAEAYVEIKLIDDITTRVEFKISGIYVDIEIDADGHTIGDLSGSEALCINDVGTNEYSTNQSVTLTGNGKYISRATHTIYVGMESLLKIHSGIVYKGTEKSVKKDGGYVLFDLQEGYQYYTVKKLNDATGEVDTDVFDNEKIEERESIGDYGYEHSFVAKQHNHTCIPASEWIRDATHHWHECTVDGCYKTGEGKDAYGLHEFENDKCNKCEAQQNKVTLYANNGTEESSVEIAVATGEYTLPECMFVVPQYKEFAGWATSPDGPVITGTTCTIKEADNNLYAIWKDYEYDIWVGGIRVTHGNKDDIMGAADDTGETEKQAAKYDPATYTLTLDNFSYTGPGYNYSEDEWAAIYTKEENLNIVLKGENTITADDNGIYVGGYDAYLEFYDYNEDSAVSSITVTARKSQDGVAIKTGSLDIKGGIIEASGNSTALIFEYAPHIYKPRYVYTGNDAPGELVAEIDGGGFSDETFTGKYVRITPVADPVEEPPYFPYIPVTPDDPLKPHRIEANEVISTEAAADNDQYAGVADQIKAVTEDAEAKIAAAKTLEEIQAAEAAAKAEIEKIRLLYDVDETGLVARSKLTTLKSGKEAVLVKWYDKSGRDIDFEGYEIFRSTERYKGYGTKPFFETTREKYYNTAIEEGHTYYYRVRGYVTVDGERVYTELSTKAWRTIK